MKIGLVHVNCVKKSKIFTFWRENFHIPTPTGWGGVHLAHLRCKRYDLGAKDEICVLTERPYVTGSPTQNNVEIKNNAKIT